MKNEKLLDDVCELIHIDIDAAAAYAQALANIEDNDIHKHLKTFANEHSAHITSLSKWVKDNGGSVPEHKKDVKGFFIEGFTAIAAKVGLTSALKAMQQNEKLTNKRYKEALEFPGDKTLMEIIKKGYEDEVKHLQYINEQLEKK